jgi:hypothetical protein
LKNGIEAISKKSFAPISLLVPRSKSSKYYSIPAGCDPLKRIKPDGKSRNAGNLTSAVILEQNLFFEMVSNDKYGICAAGSIDKKTLYYRVVMQGFYLGADIIF